MKEHNLSIALLSLNPLVSINLLRIRYTYMVLMESSLLNLEKLCYLQIQVMLEYNFFGFHCLFQKSLILCLFFHLIQFLSKGNDICLKMGFQIHFALKFLQS